MLMKTGIGSTIDFAKHDVQRTKNRCNIGKHMPPRHHVHCLQMRKTRWPELAAIGLVGAVRYQIDAEFALGAFSRGIDRSEEHTSELQSLMRISYAVF